MEVASILVHYGNECLTNNTIQTLFHSSVGVDTELIVYLNSDVSSLMATEWRSNPKIHIIGDGLNIGFAKAVNTCVRYIQNQNPEYYWLINNDLMIHDLCTNKLVESMRQDKQLGAVSPIILDKKNNTVWFDGGTVNVKSWETKHGPLCRDGDRSYLTGCALFIRKQAFDQIGFLDERFWMYFEDVDWSLRAQNNGWKLCVVEDCYVTHEVSAGTEDNLDFRRYWMSRNAILISRKYGSTKSQLTVIKTQAVIALKNTIRQFVFRRRRPWKGQTTGVIHGVFYHL